MDTVSSDTGTDRQVDTAQQARISALVALLADDDPEVGVTILDHLRDAGEAAKPSLMAALDDPNPTLSERARSLLDELGQNALLTDLRAYADSGARNLEEGLLLLARLDNPNLDTAACTNRISRLAEDLMIRLDPGDGVDAMLSAWSRYLFSEQGFSGNSDDYHNPNNSYLHTILDTRRGIPISLSSLYIILAHRLGLPIQGIGMPGHFLIKFDDGQQMRIIDPFHHGRLLDNDDCQRLLRGLGLSFDDRYLEPVSNRYILERSLKNLIEIFSQQNAAAPLALHQQALEILRGS